MKSFLETTFTGAAGETSVEANTREKGCWLPAAGAVQEGAADADDVVAGGSVGSVGRIGDVAWAAGRSGGSTRRRHAIAVAASDAAADTTGGGGGGGGVVAVGRLLHSMSALSTTLSSYSNSYCNSYAPAHIPSASRRTKNIKMLRL